MHQPEQPFEYEPGDFLRQPEAKEREPVVQWQLYSLHPLPADRLREELDPDALAEELLDMVFVEADQVHLGSEPAPNGNGSSLEEQAEQLVTAVGMWPRRVRVDEGAV